MPTFFVLFQASKQGKKKPWTAHLTTILLKNLVLLFTSFLAIPLARQCCFDASLLAGLQVVGMTLYFLDDVFLLYLALKPAQCILKRFAFLQANLCQRVSTSKPARKAQ